MHIDKKLNAILKYSKRMIIDNKTKIVIMSDCHRGNGDNYDNFIKNENLFKAALQHYYDQGFIYIELGDGDDMWEVQEYGSIIERHLDTFKQLKKFNDNDRLIMIYGNHDMVKKSPDILEKYFYKYYNKITKKDETLLDNLIVYESLILNYEKHDILLIHGHQFDFLNSTLWRFSRFLVRYVWRNLEHIGLKDPTSAAKNYQVMRNTEKKLKTWSIKNNKILISGHTHRPIFPKIGQSLYFNDGSCIHPDGITCLEIENGKITLVKWEFEITDAGLKIIARKVIDGSKPIIKFFNKINKK